MLTKRIVTTDYELTISREELLDLIREKASSSFVPENAEVFVKVPSGGDYSGMDLDIKDCPIQITWTIRSKE